MKNILKFFRIGKPELFATDYLVRLEQIKYANKRFEAIKSSKWEPLKGKIDENTTLFIKGYGNDTELISCFRGLLSNSRELLDSLLFYINKTTNRETNTNFIKFSNGLLNGSYDNLDLPIIKFFKNNFTYIFHIRKFRNEIKNKISNIEFMFITDHFEAKFKVPIKNDESYFVQFLDIKNREEAMQNNSYFCTIKLDVYFPEMIKFWEAIFKIMNIKNT